MKIKTLTARHKAFSLVEVIVFVAVLSVALVSLIASVSYSSLLLNDARYKLVATRYSEELAEWLKFQREYNSYDTLLSKITVPAGTTYCFSSDTLAWPAPGACGTNYPLDGVYQRELLLVQRTSEIEATVSTLWRYLSFTKRVSITLKFNNYGL